MESGSKNSLARTYDNVEAISKRILIFLSDTFDNINIFQGDEAKSCKIQLIGQAIFVNCSADRLFLANSQSHR